MPQRNMVEHGVAYEMGCADCCKVTAIYLKGHRGYDLYHNGDLMPLRWSPTTTVDQMADIIVAGFRKLVNEGEHGHAGTSTEHPHACQHSPACNGVVPDASVGDPVDNLAGDAVTEAESIVRDVLPDGPEPTP